VEAGTDSLLYFNYCLRFPRERGIMFGYGLIAFMHMRTHDNSEKQRETANIAAVFSRAVAAEREDFCGEDITGG
jgi:hypothetical protein